MEVTKKLFFHLFDLTILNSHILSSSLGGKKISHRDFQNTLLWNLLAQAEHERNVQRPIGRPPAAITQVLRLEERDRKHGPILSATQGRCRACLAKGVTRNVSMICEKCDVALCCDTTCFWDYHTKANLWNISGYSTGSPYVKLGPQRLGNRMLCIFNRTAEISLCRLFHYLTFNVRTFKCLVLPCWPDFFGHLNLKIAGLHKNRYIFCSI